MKIGIVDRFILFLLVGLFSRRIGPLTSALHLSLSLATLVASVHVWTLRSFLSLSVVLLHVSLGRPLFLLQSGVHETANLACLVLSMLNTCPNHFQLLRLMSMLISSISSLRLTSSFVTLCGQYVFKILLIASFTVKVVHASTIDFRFKKP